MGRLQGPSMAGIFGQYLTLLKAFPQIRNFLPERKWTTSESNIDNSNTGNVAIGITNPTAKFHVQSREFGTEGVTAYINPIWNTSGNPTAFKVNPLVIGNGGASLLADFQYSGISRFSI